MRSRYDYMKEGDAVDSVTQDIYPDPLSFNFNAFKAINKLEAVELDDSDINRFWMTTYKQYNSCEYDDIVLSLNGISHKNFLAIGDILYFPNMADVENSFSKRGV